MDGRNIDNSTIIVGNFNAPVSIVGITTAQKVDKKSCSTMTRLNRQLENILNA